MMASLYDKLIAEIEEQRTKGHPTKAEKAALTPILSPVEGLFKALVGAELASDFATFPINGGIGCCCKLEGGDLIVAHCTGPLDNNQTAEIKVGKGKSRLVFGSHCLTSRHAAPRPNENIGGMYSRV